MLKSFTFSPLALIFTIGFVSNAMPIVNAQTSGPSTIDNTQGGIVMVVMLGLLLGFLVYLKIISYPVEIICTNCNYRFKRTIKKGVSFEKATRKRKCPRCHNTGCLIRYSDYERSSRY